MESRTRVRVDTMSHALKLFALTWLHDWAAGHVGRCYHVEKQEGYSNDELYVCRIWTQHSGLVAYGETQTQAIIHVRQLWESLQKNSDC